MKLTAAAASVAVLGLLLAGCGGSSNTADVRACKAGIKAELSKSLSSVPSGPPQIAPPASCSGLSQADITRLNNEVQSELNSRPSIVHLPAQLFGLKKITDTRARAVIRKSTGRIAADRQTFRQPPWGAEYGSHTGRAIIVFGAMFTVAAAVIAQSDPGFDKNLAASATKTWPKTRAFPAGAHGGALYCADQISGLPLTACLWADKVGAGEVRYFSGSASSLSDAAAKTNQIRAIIEP